MQVCPNQFELICVIVLKYLCFSVGLAAAVPRIDLFSALLGAICTSTLSIIAPTIIHTVVFWGQFHGASGKIKVARNAFLLILGVAGMATGTGLSIKDIISYYANVEGEDGYSYECD